MLKNNQIYNNTLKDIKTRIYAGQYAAMRAVNKELINLYWDIGKIITEKQKMEGWGKSVVQQLAKDLQIEFSGIRGFSLSNLWAYEEFLPYI